MRFKRDSRPAGGLRTCVTNGINGGFIQNAGKKRPAPQNFENFLQGTVDFQFSQIIVGMKRRPTGKPRFCFVKLSVLLFEPIGKRLAPKRQPFRFRKQCFERFPKDPRILPPMHFHNGGIRIIRLRILTPCADSQRRRASRDITDMI